MCDSQTNSVLRDHDFFLILGNVTENIINLELLSEVNSLASVAHEAPLIVICFVYIHTATPSLMVCYILSYSTRSLRHGFFFFHFFQFFFFIFPPAFPLFVYLLKHPSFFSHNCFFGESITKLSISQTNMQNYSSV